MHHLACKVSHSLLKHRIIDENMIEIYIYGLEIIFSSLFTTLSILLIGLFMKSFGFTLLYLIITIPLKLYAGGYHAETYKKCFFISNVSFFITLCIHRLICTYCQIPILFKLMILYCSSLYIFRKSPVTNSHHPLTIKKQVKNKKLTKKILIFLNFTITIFINLIPANTVSDFAILCIMSVALFIIPTQIKEVNS